MITARQFRSGLIVEMDKDLILILEAQHIKPGKGGAFMRTRMKNLKTGAITEENFKPEDSFPQAFIEEKVLQYLYKDHSQYHFMDQSTYDEIAISEDLIGDNVKFLKDGMEITTSMHKNNIVAVALPPFVDLKVTYTEPGIKGDTARGGTKPATLETGAIIKVPLFIDTNDMVTVDTRTGEYSGRV